MSYEETKKWRKKYPIKWRMQRRRYYKQFIANADNSGQLWTVSDINLVLKKTLSDRRLAKLFGRSVKAIQCLRSRMKEDKNVNIM